MKKPYIVSVGRHGCIRQQKQGIALRNDVALHYLTEKKVGWQKYAQTAMLYANQGQFRSEVALHRKADIFHVHTEPFWYVQAIKEVLPNATVVLDLHDSMYFRFDDPARHMADERCAIEMADALVYVSHDCRRLINGWIPASKKKPWVVLPSYVNQGFYKLGACQRQGGIVNEGRADTMDAPDWYDYCKYHDLAKALKDAGIVFTLYGGAGDEKTVQEYQPLCEYMGHVPYEELLRQLGCYDWGLCGNLAPFEEWEVAMPNKLFEYIAAGIPIIAMNCATVEQFVKREGIGIAAHSIADIKRQWDKRAKCQENVIKKRFNWTMEKHIHDITQLYKSLLRREGTPRGRKRQAGKRTSEGDRGNGSTPSRQTVARAGSVLRPRVSHARS